ncbi:hypothetical protein ACWGIV_25895 [Streptomyces sp. NPDC054844]
MSRTTGPILALGAITVVNSTVFNERDMDWRVPIATGLALVGFSLAEKVFPDGAQVLAWTALLATLLTRIEPGTPSPVESAMDWWESSKSSGEGGGGSSGSREV